MVFAFTKKLYGLNQVTQHMILFVLMTSCLTCLFAEDNDFNKLGTLAKQRYGEEAYLDILELEKLTAQLRSAPEAEKLKQMNAFFNAKITFANDIDVWGVVDYWASPLESIGLRAGDCEDFSIAKYVFLKSVGVPNERLRLTYVRATISNQGHTSVQAHMVLSYYLTPQSEPLILDSLVSDIMPASERKDLSPIFGFNDKELWVGNNRKPKSDSQTHLSKWRDVLTRMQADGIK